MKAAPKYIRSFTNAYEFLSNSFPAWVEYEGLYFPTVENAFQAAKTTDLSKRMKFCTILDIETVVSMGDDLALREDWEDVKVQIMRQLIFNKFTHNKVYGYSENCRSIRDRLIETGTAFIEYSNSTDKFWGIVKGEGENQLGKIIMEIRDKFVSDTKTYYSLIERWDALIDDMYGLEETTMSDFKALFLETWRYMTDKIIDNRIERHNISLTNKIAAFSKVNIYPKNFKPWEFDAAIDFSKGLLNTIEGHENPYLNLKDGYIETDFTTARIDEFEEKITDLGKELWENTYADEDDYEDSED